MLQRLPLRRFFSNVFANSTQYARFLNENFNGHQINLELKPNQERTTVVVGGGIVGMSTAMYLCQNTNDNVVVVEKKEDVGQETSNANGGIMGLEYNIIWVSRAIWGHYWRSITQRDYPFKFRIKALREKHMIRWIFNMLVNLRNDQENLDKIDNLAKLSGVEFEKLQRLIPGKNYHVTAQGLLSLYRSIHDYETKADFYSRKAKKGFNFREIPEAEIPILEPILRNSPEKFLIGALWPMETNVETELLTKSILQYCETNYSRRFKLLKNTEANGFLINPQRNSNELLGLNTQNGIVHFDRVVVAAGLQSKDVLSQLNIPCLLAPVKGYTLSVPSKHLSHPLKTIVSDEKNRMSFSQLGNIARIAAFAEFTGRDKTLEPKRIKQITELLEEKIGKLPEEGRVYWTGLRPVSPDDVPMVGRVKKLRNLFINAGHGSKGTTLALGSARILMEMMNNEGKESVRHKDYEFERFY